MATWSITPDTGLVSIDNTGKLTYSEHTEDTVYTISYVGDDGCTASKDITIKKCVKQGIKVKVVDTKFGTTTANYAVLYTDYEGIGTSIYAENIEVNGPAKDCDMDSKFINTNITEVIVKCGDDYYSATYAPSEIENGQTYTLTLDKKVQYVGKSLYFNVSRISGGTPGQQYVFNALGVRVSIVKAGQTLLEHVREFSCPCPGDMCTEGYELTSSINFGFGEYIDADISLEGAIVYVNIDNAVARDKDTGNKCNYLLKNVECLVPGWSGSMQSWYATYSDSLNAGSFNMSFQ